MNNFLRKVIQARGIFFKHFCFYVIFFMYVLLGVTFFARAHNYYTTRLPSQAYLPLFMTLSMMTHHTPPIFLLFINYLSSTKPLLTSPVGWPYTYGNLYFRHHRWACHVMFHLISFANTAKHYHQLQILSTPFVWHSYLSLKLEKYEINRRFPNPCS